jgi:hypothetical protein
VILLDRKKKSVLGDVADLTKVSLASGAGFIAVNSLPSTPTVPAVDVMKANVGGVLGVLPVVSGAGALLRSVKELEKISKGK